MSWSCVDGHFWMELKITKKQKKRDNEEEKGSYDSSDKVNKNTGSE